MMSATRDNVGRRRIKWRVPPSNHRQTSPYLVFQEETRRSQTNKNKPPKTKTSRKKTRTSQNIDALLRTPPLVFSSLRWRARPRLGLKMRRIAPLFGRYKKVAARKRARKRAPNLDALIRPIPLFLLPLLPRRVGGDHDGRRTRRAQGGLS